MNAVKSKLGFYLTVPLSVGLYMVVWPLIFHRNSVSMDGIIWVVPAMIIAFMLAITLYPKKGKRTYLRMIAIGLIIPILVIFFVGVLYGLLNPGWAGGGASVLDSSVNVGFSAGLVFVAFFSIATFFTPYFTGILIASMFVEQ